MQEESKKELIDEKTQILLKKLDTFFNKRINEIVQILSLVFGAAGLLFGLFFIFSRALSSEVYVQGIILSNFLIVAGIFLLIVSVVLPLQARIEEIIRQNQNK